MRPAMPERKKRAKTARRLGILLDSSLSVERPVLSEQQGTAKPERVFGASSKDIIRAPHDGHAPPSIAH